MPSKIIQLPDALVARIAAGEVVERPASVLKELLENSLDAGSTSITVRVEGAGRTLLSVSDNGTGMSPADARMALKRHATSKISNYEDLETISSYGFRGEALPSIVSVSRVRMVTKTEESDVAVELLIEGGDILSEKPAAREQGTTFEIRDLFFNTPARYKFLKSDATERAQCLRVIEEMVFSAPHVGFQVYMEKEKPLIFQAKEVLSQRRHPGPSTNAQDGERKSNLMIVSRDPGSNASTEINLDPGLKPAGVTTTPGVEEDSFLAAIKTRLGEAWGSRWPGIVTSVLGRQSHFLVKGFVSHPGHHQSSMRHQFLFVNKRPVQNRRLARAVYDAFIGQLPQQRHPGWVLFLDVNPQSVDVNVHPSKREVKLTFESEIYSFLVSTIRTALQQTPTLHLNLSPLASVETRPQAYEPFFSKMKESTQMLYQPSSASSVSTLPPMLSGVASEPLPVRQEEFSSLKSDHFTAVGHIRNTYILAHSAEGLVVVDQHAAAERVLYEKIFHNLKTEEKAIQMLLVPFVWEVAVTYVPMVNARLSAMNNMGFLVAPFGPQTYSVTGVPAALGDKVDLHSLLDNFIDILDEQEGMRGGQERSFEHRLAAMSACKGSIKAGDPLDLKACQTVLDNLLLAEAPMTCPHGRPTVLRLSYSELDRRFRRS